MEIPSFLKVPEDKGAVLAEQATLPLTPKQVALSLLPWSPVKGPPGPKILPPWPWYWREV